ncbi:hypothetical protein [Streptomyces sp. NPDC126522]
MTYDRMPYGADRIAGVRAEARPVRVPYACRHLGGPHVRALPGTRGL